MENLPETAKGRGIALDQLERTNNLITKKMKNRKIYWAVNSSKAAGFASLSCSFKLEAVLLPAERVVAARGTLIQQNKPPRRNGRMPERKDQAAQLNT